MFQTYVRLLFSSIMENIRSFVKRIFLSKEDSLLTEPVPIYYI